MTRIKIACISDTHGAHRSVTIPECDLLLHAGDLTNVGEYDLLRDFNSWGKSIPLPSTHKLCVAGNHECTLEGKSREAKDLLPEWTYLQDQSHTVAGLKVWGSPWSPEFYPEKWKFQLERGPSAEEFWDVIPEDTDIVVVHGPPYGFGDTVIQGYPVGCEALARRLDKVKPRLTVCGHIHHSYGVYESPWGLVVNAAIMTEEYRPLNSPIVVEL